MLDMTSKWYIMMIHYNRSTVNQIELQYQLDSRHLYATSRVCKVSSVSKLLTLAGIYSVIISSSEWMYLSRTLSWANYFLFHILWSLVSPLTYLLLAISTSHNWNTIIIVAFVCVRITQVTSWIPPNIQCVVR